MWKSSNLHQPREKFVRNLGGKTQGMVVKWVVLAWSMAYAQHVAVQNIVLKFNVAGIFVGLDDDS